MNYFRPSSISASLCNSCKWAHYGSVVLWVVIGSAVLVSWTNKPSHGAQDVETELSPLLCSSTAHGFPLYQRPTSDFQAVGIVISSSKNNRILCIIIKMIIFYIVFCEPDIFLQYIRHFLAAIAVRPFVHLTKQFLGHEKFILQQIC